MVGAILIMAVVGGCARSADQPSQPAESAATTALVQTPIPTAVATLATPTPSPTVAATPLSTASPPVPADLVPVKGTVLPIAGRDGAPGAISCSGLGRFTFATIPTPMGAENLPGPEFDVLRATIARYGDDPEFASLKKATFGEVHRDQSSVVFLGDVGNHEGPFAIVQASFDGASWKWAGMGDCRLVGEPGDGWGAANWVIDPAFQAPTANSRKLHLRVSEADCNPNVPIVGRLAPAYVFFEPGTVRIQMFVRTVEPSGSCAGLKPTALGPSKAVTVTLPEPLGTRRLEDATPRPCRGCGG